MTIEDKFQAAVNVIRGLPKNGPYQPSSSMQLRFYANFKQATEGPCKQKRPAFWDVIGRAKYDAWKELGELPREKAMVNYVDDLKKIVETMSYTENVAEFMGSINDLDNVNVDDLEKVAPEAIQKVQSRPNSPFRSRETSPIHVPVLQDSQEDKIKVITNGYTNGYADSNSDESSDVSDDEYIDTVEDDIPITPVEHYSRSKEKRDYSQYNGAIPNSSNIDPALITTLVHLTDRMKLDIAQVNSRINVLENKIRANKKYPSWWPFEDISPAWFALGFMWPIVAITIFRIMDRRAIRPR